MAKRKKKEKKEKMDAAESTNPEENGESQAQEDMVAYTIEEVDLMKQDIEDARIEAEKNLAGWQRALADYTNLKRQVEQERGQMKKEAVGKVIAPFLEIMEDLDIAIRNKPEDNTHQAWDEGIELVYRKLVSKLEAQGVRVMNPAGQPFDPRYHEAISQEPSDEVESGHVIEMIKPGYLIGERVLRPALVRVAA